MPKVRRDPIRGVLDKGSDRIHVERYLPPDDLADRVEHFWTVSWDMRGLPPWTTETLPHPSVHLVLEAGRSEIVGILRGKFTRELVGEGRVFAVKFRPGGFYAYLGAPVATVTDRRLPVDDVFDVDVRAVERAVFGERAGDDDARIATLSGVLARRARVPDPELGAVTRLAAMVDGDPSILKVDDLVPRSGFDKRTLQRLFRTYVGVSPKWVIKRYRLLQAADRIARGECASMAELSSSLGYFDQAHFNRDFRAIVGASPGAFARRVAAPAGAKSAP